MMCLLPSRILLVTRSPMPAASSPLSDRDGDRSVVKQFESESVSFFAEVVQMFGVPRSIGQIYGALYASPVPLSFSDIVERLEISKGSVSQGLQLLRSLGAINIVDAKRQDQSAKRSGEKVGPGFPIALHASPSAPDAGRREYFKPELSLRKLVNGVLRERIAPMAATGTERLKRLRGLAEQGGEEKGFYLDRARQLSIWRRRLKTVLPVLSAVLGPKK